MGLNLGAFAGGIADGYRKQNADNRAQAQAKIAKDQADRQEADQKKRDEVLASVAKADQERRAMTPSADLAPLPAAAGIVSNPNGAPQDAGMDSAPAAQSASPASGIGKPAAQPATPSLRPHTQSDKMQMIDDTFSGFLSNGLLDDAAKVAPIRMALVAEKLQNESKAREDSARQFIAAINSGNDEAALSAGQSLSSMVPDGKNMTGFKTLPDGKVQVQYGDGAPTVIPMQQLTAGVIAMADWRTALGYVNQTQQQALAAAKNQQEADRYAATAEETHRHNVASEGIARTNADKVTTGTETAEIKNVNFLVKNGIASNAKDAWKMVQSGKTPQGEKIISDGMGGVMVVEQESGQVSTVDSKGVTKIIRPGKAGDPPMPGAQLAPDGKWYIKGSDGKYSRVDN